MWPVDTAAATHAARHAVVSAHIKASGKAVDLTKKYVSHLDVVYSSAMRRIPNVPRFLQENLDD